MNELSESVRQLPDTLEDLSRFVLIGRAQLKAVRDAIKHIDKIGVAKEVHEQKLREAQEIAEAVLDAETKLGELTSKMEKAVNQHSAIRNGAKSKKEQLEEVGINKDQAFRFETLASHPEVVEQAKADARANGRIVTRADVLNRIAPPKSHQQTLKEIEKQARAEHREFAEKKKDAVVNFKDIEKDQKNQRIIINRTNNTIKQAICTIGNINFISSADMNLMVDAMTEKESDWYSENLREGIKILNFILRKIEGREK